MGSDLFSLTAKSVALKKMQGNIWQKRLETSNLTSWAPWALALTVLPQAQ